MKLNYKFSLTLIASLAIILPMTAFADDQKQDEKKTKRSAGHQRGAEVAPQDTSHAAPAATGRSRGENARSDGRSKAAPLSSVAPVTPQAVQPTKRIERSQRNQSPSIVAPAIPQRAQPSNRLERSQRDQNQPNVAPAPSRHVQPINRLERGQRNQTHELSDQKAYNRGNNYGGLWFSENTHADWSREGKHYWNRHNYRWYEGGWLIIDGGYSPYGFNTGSTASNVQMSLANQGYYSGEIDGDIGPASRNAIADYQSDHDLTVTGRINSSLLRSLQVE